MLVDSELRILRTFLEWKQSEKLGNQSLEATTVASQEKANDAVVEMGNKSINGTLEARVTTFCIWFLII